MQTILFLSFLLFASCMPAVLRRERAAVAKTVVVTDSLLQLTAYYLSKSNWDGKTILIFRNVSRQPLSIQLPKESWAVWLTLKDAAGVYIESQQEISSAPVQVQIEEQPQW